MNAYKHGLRGELMRDIQRMLRKQKDILNKL